MSIMQPYAINWWQWRFCFTYIPKGGLISKSFSFWLKSPKKVPDHNPEHLLFRWIVLKIMFWHPFFLRLEPKWKLSEIKPTLVRGYLSGEFWVSQAKEDLVKIFFSNFSYWASSTPRGHVLTLKTFRQIPVLSWAIRYSVFQKVKSTSSLEFVCGTLL